MADLSLPQDPNELFDVVTFDGRPTGRVKARGAVHRDGDWHRAVHVWVIGTDENGPFVTFQRRSRAKDTWAGKLDATVGGHFRAGEQLEETLREVEEEIGVQVQLADLIPAGIRTCVNEAETGIVDHELQEVFFLVSNRPLTDYSPSPAELESLLRFPLSALLEFLAGHAESVEGLEFAVSDGKTREMSAGMDDFVLLSDRYFYRVAIAASLVLRGESYFSV